MEREIGLAKLAELKGVDLVELANLLSVPILGASGKKNKGWAGHVFERHLGLPLNSSRAPNFGSWELKSVSLKLSKKGVLGVKETMAITMLDPVEVAAKEFEDSHLYTKLRKWVVVARLWESVDERRSLCLGSYPFDLAESGLFFEVKRD